MKVSFFGALVLGRVGEVSVSDDTGVPVASLLDLAAQKVRVVQVRAERKDYLDLATLKALSYFDDGDLAELPDVVKRRLVEAASLVRAVDPVVLRSIDCSDCHSD